MATLGFVDESVKDGGDGTLSRFLVRVRVSE